MATQEQTQEGKTYPPAGEERTVTARFYAGVPGEEPSCVIVDGVVYSRDSEQEYTHLILEEQDLRAEVLARYGKDAADLAFRITCTQEQIGDLHEEQVERRLLLHLPQHKPVIEYAFCPDGSPLLTSELTRHEDCVLPPAEPEPEEE